mmetsp:Transcript_4485/g.7592  ORF Transcript_4485/g.7592 Transcript_4485/m.7592 type:complete len:235 (-) Transcript_4485:28-732(-)
MAIAHFRSSPYRFVLVLNPFPGLRLRWRPGACSDYARTCFRRAAYANVSAHEVSPGMPRKNRVFVNEPLPRSLTLGLDYGSVRVGVAIGQTFAPSPLCILPNRKIVTAIVDDVLNLANKQSVGQLVVGFPLNADGSEGRIAKVILQFARTLSSRTSKPVYLWNERYSSVMAEEYISISRNFKRSASYEPLDAVAAAVILGEFMDAQGVGAEIVSKRRSRKKIQSEKKTDVSEVD